MVCGKNIEKLEISILAWCLPVDYRKTLGYTIESPRQKKCLLGQG